MITIHTISLQLTTFCNRKCPYCCCAIPSLNKKEHFDIPYFEKLIPYFKSMNLTITGGEPTIHPSFHDVTLYIKEKFSPPKYVLVTNGYGFNKLPMEYFLKFNKIIITEYDNPSNSVEIKDFKVRVPRTIQLEIWDKVKIPHIKKAKGIKPCPKRVSISGVAAYENGLLYPCCVITKREIGIPLDDNWSTKILEVPTSCNGCIFGR